MPEADWKLLDEGLPEELKWKNCWNSSNEIVGIRTAEEIKRARMNKSEPLLRVIKYGKLIDTSDDNAANEGQELPLASESVASRACQTASLTRITTDNAVTS